MPTTEQRRNLDEIARIGTDLIERCIAHTLSPADVDKCIAVDINSGEYEVDDDDYSAVHRLHVRVPSAEVWLAYVDPDRMDRMGARF